MSPQPPSPTLLHNLITLLVIKRKNLFYLLLWSFVLLAAYFPVFLHLDALPMWPWDESFFAENAREMANNGNYIVKYLDGVPDMGNTKPPLMTWAQVIGLKLFGYDTLGLRLPIAICGFLAILALFRFGLHDLGDWRIGLLATGFLLTAPAWCDLHMVRTGDHDAAFAYFSLGAILSFYRFVHHQKTRDWIVCLLFLWAGIMTKSVLGLLVILPLCVFAPLTGKFALLIRQKRVWAGVFMLLFLVCGYYLWREMLNPGYLAAVWQNEIGGRYTQTLDQHYHPFYWYFQELLQKRLSPWIWLSPLSLLPVFWKRLSRYRDLVILLWLCVLIYWGIISCSATKLAWYDAPMLPWLSLLSAVGLGGIWELVCERIKFNEVPKRILTFLIICLLFFLPYQNIIKENYHPRVDWAPVQYPAFFEQIEKDHPEIKKFSVTHLNRHYLIDFYTKTMNMQKGYQIQRHQQETELLPGEYTVTCQHNMRKEIEERFEVTVVSEYKKCRLYWIGGVRR